MWRDKQQAVRGGWRVSERHLFTAALAGGGAGVWLGMKQFRHKTTRPAFRIGIPCIAVINGLLFALVLFGLW
ncbi:uncharacterized membrane protein YsdA (DUF1294 family) [Desmospora profundinema]|uniref:Uncharacterized membrane protein YsdA (DUF1294 family) n=2 Tax=Desmospora profundinema TaxID=1571184 RepID=A0ABU1ILQ9_9BACL|nr:uncharacterized membrane protein YsdA (DUF1294 family) [Desmospora profundinema]